MCFDDQFRLCSCDAAQLSEADIGWTLTVQNAGKPAAEMMGRCRAPDPLSEDDTMTQEHVVTELNARNCFDFELEAGRMYHARIRVPGSTLWMDCVRDTGGAWAAQQVNGLTRWLPQMESAGQGLLQVRHPGRSSKSSPTGGFGVAAAAEGNH
jgi:hypothetical protein